MISAANQPSFELSIAAGGLGMRVLAFSGEEALNRPYSFDLHLVSEQASVSLEQYLHGPAYFTFAGRGVHGVIGAIAQGDSGPRFTHYHISLTPRLARLAHRTNQRIFQGLDVPQIIRRVLEEHGILGDSYRFNLSGIYAPREYCVQYAESDLHFIQRLCEEEGLSYHFEHSPERHVMVFGDDHSAFAHCGPARLQTEAGLVPDGPAIQRLSVRLATRATQVTLRDHDFRKPRLELEQRQGSAQLPALEDYHYPGGFTHAARGRERVRRALESQRGDACLAMGESDMARLAAGHAISLGGHSREAWNSDWLLTQVSHEGNQPQVLEAWCPNDAATAGGGLERGYRNGFTAIPARTPFRPRPCHPKPRLGGSQRAVITGPVAQEVYCDAYGRVKVQFYWDREGPADGTSSAWLRVASRWAGDGYGAIVLPRVGMEVLVSFLDGDPDHPVVTGCLYHGEHPTPYALPAGKSRSVFKTRTQPDGGGFNELRIEDRKGREQVFVHVHRDWRQRVGHDHKVHVGHQRLDTVEGNSHVHHNAEEHLTVGQHRAVEVRGNDHLTVTGTQRLSIGDRQVTEAGTQIDLASGQTIVFAAGAEITLKAGAGWLKIAASGIDLNGPVITFEEGGIAASGAGLPGLGRPDEPAPAGFASTGGAGLIPGCGKLQGGGCSREDCPCL